MRKFTIYAVLFFATAIHGFALKAADNNGEQSLTISGQVTAATDGMGLPGVNVVVKETQNGTITDMNGMYSITVADPQATLVFSYVGYITEEIPINGRSDIDLALVESMEALQEVVVTALGIKREERSLGYSVGRVEGEEVTRVAQENVLNSLSGKVAGVTINSTGGTGSSVSMVIRGATSLSTDNQPLFVIDGVPVINTLNNMTQFGDRNIVDYGNAISDLNPNDVEDITILKGPSAAALYGNRAGNGVVLITTKSGSRAKRPSLTVSSNTVIDVPFSYLKVQNKFATGIFSFTPDNFGPGEYPVINPNEAVGTGMELDRGYFGIQWDAPLDANGFPVPTELVSYPDNVANFVQNAVTSTNGVSLANSNDIMNYRVGFTNMSSRGLVPNSDLYRNNLTLNSSIKAVEKVTFSTNVNVNRSWSNNRPSSNRGTNPLEWAYKVPRNIDIRKLKDYWEPGLEGFQQRTVGVDYDNPYFLAHEVQNSFTRNRVFGNIKADWEITPDLNLMGRYAIDYYDEERETKIAPSYSREPNNGTYGLVNFRNYERNADFLLTYSKIFDKFGMSVSGGGNARYNRSSSVRNSSSGGLVVPNVYTISNITNSNLQYNSSWSQRAVYSVYGIANLSWNDIVYLDLTARNDWSSTLPEENQSFFYPSASLSLLLNEMVNMGSNVDLIKLRAGYAQVGNDASPYQLFPVYGDAGQWGNAPRLSKPSTILTPSLQNELATSWEAGIDFNLFNNRMRFEGTYYEMDNENQIIRNIPIPSSSGFDRMNINAGLLESRGWEFLIGGTPIQSNGWTFDISANFTRNRTKITELAPGVDVIRFWEDAKGGAFTYVGEDIGDIYDAEMITVEDPNSPYFGYPILPDIPLEEWQANEGGAELARNKIGNYNPDFLMGMQAALSWKNISLNLTFDWRKGGEYISRTFVYTTEDGNSQLWLDRAINPEGRTGQELRDWLVENEETMIKDGFYIVGGPTKEYGGFPEAYSGQVVYDGYFIPGVVQTAGQDTPNDFEDDVYRENLGEDLDETYISPYVLSYPWSFATPSLFPADFVKLREAAINYQLPASVAERMKLQSASVGVYTRNVVLWTKGKNGVDPERAFQAESGSGNRGTQFKQGIELYNVDPWVFPIGFKLNLTF